MTVLSPARQRSTLLLLAAVQFTHVMDFMIMMPLGPQLMRAFAIGPGPFSRIVAVYGLSAGACGMLATFVLDRFDRKRALLWLYAGFTLATLACALSREYWMLLAARVLAGAFGGVASSVVTAMVGDVVPPERRGWGMAFVMSAFSLAQIFGVPCGLWLAGKNDWHAPFLVLVGVGCVVALAGIFVLPRINAHLAERGSQSNWSRVAEIASHPNHWRAFGLVAAIAMSGMVMVPFIAPAVVRNGGVAESSLQWIYFFGGLATLVTNNALGRLGDRFGHARVFGIMAVTSVLPVLALTNVQTWPLPLILVITTIFMITMGGRWVPAMALVTMSVQGRLRGGFMSLNSALQSVAGAVASMISGWIVIEGADGRLHRYGWAGAVSLGFLLIGWAVVGRVKIVDTHATPRPPEPESGAMD